MRTFRGVKDDRQNGARWVRGGAELPRRAPMGDAGNIASALSSPGYDERPVESALELDELVRLRAELSWADWKSHPRFKKDRVLGEAQRTLGAGWGALRWPVLPGVGAELRPANDVPDATSPLPPSLEAELMADEAYLQRCDAAFEAWIDALDAQGPDNDE